MSTMSFMEIAGLLYRKNFIVKKFFIIIFNDCPYEVTKKELPT